MLGVMARLDLLDSDEVPEPVYPGPVQLSQAFGPQITGGEAAAAMVSRSSPGSVRIPVRKFSTTAGLIVTPRECAALAAKLSLLTRADYEARVGPLEDLSLLALVRRFGRFAAHCAYTGGFSVHLARQQR